MVTKRATEETQRTIEAYLRQSAKSAFANASADTSAGNSKSFFLPQISLIFADSVYGTEYKSAPARSPTPDACHRSSREKPSFNRFPGSRMDLSFVSSINFRILFASKILIFLSFINPASSAAL